MGLVASINFFLALFVDCCKQLRQGRVWLILAAYFILVSLVLFAHHRFYEPMFWGLVQPWLGALNEQNAIGFIHYPGHFLTLPYFFGWARFFIGLPVEGAVMGAIAVMFYEGYLGRKTARPASGQERLFIWLQVTVAWLLINGLIVMVFAWLPELLSSQLEKSPRRIFVFKYMFQPSLVIVIRALFFFAIPYTAIHRVHVLRGLFNSVIIFVQRPFLCLFSAGLLTVVPLGLFFVVQDPTSFVESFRPELVFWLLLTGLVVDMVVYAFWMGAAARFLVEHD
ncbi:MAG: hypothetical protein JSV52_03055 [Candidatus Zixiibacteriota bacterium]|nr:MAG: hypothetical protein JSV52_03055 [candidate division Zixibacteria bacterium]